MIHLGFAIVDSELDVNSPESLNAGIVTETVFIMPVFLTVDGTNVLGLPNGNTASLPLIGFASKALAALQRLKPGGVESLTIADAGTMYFHSTNGKVRISTSGFRQGVEAEINDTLAAFRRFSKDVRRLFETRIPSIMRHPQWKVFFPK